MLLFYLLIMIMPMDEHDFWGRPLIGTLTIIKIVGLLCFVGALYRISVTNRMPRLLDSPQGKWYLAFLSVQCLNYFLQGGALDSPGVAYGHVFSIMFLFVVVPTMLYDIKQLNRAMLVAIGAIGYVSLYAIRQQQIYGGTYGFRASGMFNDANEYALIANLWIPLAFLWVLAHRRLWERAFVAGCLGSALLGTTFAASRGGLLGSAAGLLFLTIRSKKPVRNLAIVAAVMLTVLIFSPTSPLYRFQHPNYGDTQAEEARIITWKAGLRMFWAHPLVGVGIHNFRPQVVAYENPGENVTKLAHNTYIEIAAETGLPGLISFVGTLLATIYSLGLSRRHATQVGAVHLAVLALGMQAGVISYLVSAFFVTAWWEKIAWLMIFSSMALSRICTNLDYAQRDPARQHLTRGLISEFASGY